ncbi:MAG: NADH-ubiquinone oxidoreductase-F iron-sulfur binding region domain-containing protein [Coriobacteriales bacterium]
MKTIRVCCGIGCMANGAAKVVAAFEQAIDASEMQVRPYLKKVGCNGLCEQGPMCTILPDDVTYYRVTPEDVPEILDTVESGTVIERLLSPDAGEFYHGQLKVALRNTGVIDPSSLEEYEQRGGYRALRKALSMTPDEVITEVEKSNLRGRGGAGFPTGRKWRSCAGYASDVKYMLCNGDEGDPGAFMDESIMEGDPHSVLEGLVIGAYTIGAHQGYLYIRNEYEAARARMGRAIEDARVRGYLGDDVCGSGFAFDCAIVRGGGAFVCGESSALIASIEGRVGEPRPKYVRSVEKGLYDKPTVLNNVETLATIPYIIEHGGARFARIGTERSAGTKVFSLVGKVKNTGLVEVPMGISMRDLIFGIGGGIKDGRPFKAVQTGGPSGGCLPASRLDASVDYDSLSEQGTIMGSGGMIVMDDRSCMVDVARYYINFLCQESCGQCTPCREGLRWMSQLLTDICEGRGQEGDIELLERISATVADASLCSLGKTAPNPVLSTIRYFRDEYEEHIRDHRCRAGVCRNLTQFAVDPEKCAGCDACTRACPVGAISGGVREAHAIDTGRCIACGSCRNACRFDAIYVKGGAR